MICPWRKGQDPCHLGQQLRCNKPRWLLFPIINGGLATVADWLKRQKGLCSIFSRGHRVNIAGRNMRAAAQQVMYDFGGRMLAKFGNLLSLNYWPYAAASPPLFAGRVAPAWTATSSDCSPSLPAPRRYCLLKSLIRSYREWIFGVGRPGDLIEAVMDLVPVSMTQAIPVDNHHPAVYDASYQVGDSDQYPVKSKKVNKPVI